MPARAITLRPAAFALCRNGPEASGGRAHPHPAADVLVDGVRGATGRIQTQGKQPWKGALYAVEGWDQAPVSVIYGTAVGGFMFAFVRFVARAFMRSSETMPPNNAGTPSSLAAISGADYYRPWSRHCASAF